jgi:hypothetical protein
MISSRFALVASLMGLFLAACGGSQPMTAAPGAAAQPATHSRQPPFHGYYLAYFDTQVGSGLPGSSLCLQFMSSGRWSSSGSANFNGTYLSSGKELFASGVWLPSPAVYLSLQASVNDKRGSGEFITSGQGGSIFGGGTFTMMREQKRGCT